MGKWGFIVLAVWLLLLGVTQAFHISLGQLEILKPLLAMVAGGLILFKK